MTTHIHTGVIRGIDVLSVRVEVDLMRGLPGFYVVGLPGSTVRESRERVRSSLVAIGKNYPMQRLVINLVPAHIPKQSTYFDLPIAVGILAESGQVPRRCLEDTLFVGELSLAGTIEPAHGVFLLTEHAKAQGFKAICLPSANAEEANLVEGIDVIPVAHIREVCAFLEGTLPAQSPQNVSPKSSAPPGISFGDILGQEEAKYALSIAAAGNHNILFQGPPGCGKTMLAQCLPFLLPPPTERERTEIIRIHSAVGRFRNTHIAAIQRPFRQVHHTVTASTLLGGGRYPTPGEITLAHRGVLFLDELPEFSRDVLEGLREPLEDKKITVRRMDHTESYPASCMVIAAMNPCPCGYYGQTDPLCTCSDYQRQRYMKRLSGPLLDRFDISLRLRAVQADAVLLPREDSFEAKIADARKRQQKRGSGRGILTNADIPPQLLHEFCVLTEHTEAYLQLIMKKHALSMRGRARLLRVARTIADMEDSDQIHADHLTLASQFRQLLSRSSGAP